MLLNDLFETASSGSSSAGGVASFAAPLGSAPGFGGSMEASIYHSSNGIKTNRKKRKLKETASYFDTYGDCIDSPCPFCYAIAFAPCISAIDYTPRNVPHPMRIKYHEKHGASNPNERY